MLNAYGRSERADRMEAQVAEAEQELAKMQVRSCQAHSLQGLYECSVCQVLQHYCAYKRG